MSMLTEAIVTRKPVYIYDLLRGEGSHRPAPPGDGSVLPVTWRERLRDFNVRALIYRASIHVGPKRLTRDVSIIHRRQVAAGRAVWLGEPWPLDREPAPPLEDLPRAVARIRALFEPVSSPAQG
jgi:hypothetical protein